MDRRGSVADMSEFGDFTSPEAKKITVVYKRRPKQLDPLLLVQHTASTRVNGDNELDRGGCCPTKDHRSWIDRSLSSRGRRSSILSPACGKQIGHHQGFIFGDKGVTVAPRVKCQTTWADVPTALVQEQRAIFAEIDAFALKEESPIKSFFKRPQVEESSEMFLAQDHHGKFRPWNARLEAVPENTSSEITQGLAIDPLTAALLTPSLVRKVKNAVIQMSSHMYTPVPRGSKATLDGRSWEPRVSLFSKLSDVPESFSNQTIGENLFLDTGSLISGLDALQIREEEFPVHFSRIELCAPILEEARESSPHGTILDQDHEGCQLADIDKEEQPLVHLGQELLSVFHSLLQECGQTRVLTLREALSHFCDMSEVVKLGEGTFGEAFKAGGNVFKIVPMDGNFQVNGEIQKTSDDMYSEVLLSNALNKLRGSPATATNICTNFIETKATRICQGCYDPNLVRAWEDWDAAHTSENDHPMIFPDQQLYVVFVLSDGGKDLEGFVLADFNEACTVLLQVVLALAVAEEACEFEHRDLHWGNIVLAREKQETVLYRLHGHDIRVKTFGLSVSLIDFTLSRIDTGKQVQFCNLSADPALFEGQKGDIQADTYRQMLRVTGGQWEGRFPKTNCLWIHYLADILLRKKSFVSFLRLSRILKNIAMEANIVLDPKSQCATPQDKRSLRAFRKRVLFYDSAAAAVADNFFDFMRNDCL